MKRVGRRFCFLFTKRKKQKKTKKKRKKKKKKHSENQMVNEHIRFIMNDMITNDFFVVEAITSELYLKHLVDIFKQN